MPARAFRACGAVALGILCGFPASAAAQNSPFPNQSEFQKVLLNDRPGEPMSLAVLPDGRVLHTARTGEIRIHNPRNGLNTLVINMADTAQNPRGLYQHDEEGLQGIAIDPNFEENRWVYLYYSPRLNTPTDVVGTGINEGDAPETITTPEERARLALFAANEQTSFMLLSRFKFQNNRLVIASEQEIIRVPEDRGLCCHVGGQIEFDYAGHLYLSTGDDTNPFQSDGYTPIDDRDTRNPAFDARRTSGNTNDLRGKILRIRVNAGGGYSIPNGNMFGRFQAQTRPEIYAMGFRNPFRFSVNRSNGDVYVGDYSPDANMANPARGPAGQGRWMLVRQPGNYGWPFCATPDKPYVDYDFTPGAPQSGEEFNCFAPTNDSRNNTGLRRLPQVVWPEVWYSYPAGDEGLFPELLNMRGGDGIGPMGGPAYEFNPDNRSETRWPRVFDGHPLFYEWTRDYFKVFELNRPNGGQLAAMHHLFGGPESRHAEHRPGQPDGRGLRPGRRALHAGVRRRVLRRAPRGAAVADRLRAPRRVHADRDGLGDADDVDDATADGPVLERGHARSRRGRHRLRVGLRRQRHRRLASSPNPTFTYTQRGIFEATLRVTDTSGRSASNSVRITSATRRRW